MNKSATFGIVFLLALLSFLIWKGYLNLPRTNAQIDMAVPDSADFSFKIDDLNSTLNTLETSKYNSDLIKNSWYNQLSNGLKLIQDLVSDDFDSPTTVIAAYQYLKKEGDFLFCITKQNLPSQPFKFFRKIVVNKEDLVQTNKVAKITMYRTDVNAIGISDLTFAMYKGIILFSENPDLVEQSLNKLSDISTNFKANYSRSNGSIKTTQTGLKLKFSDNMVSSLLQNDFFELENFNSKLYLFNNGLIANGELKVKQNSRLSILAKHTLNSYGKILALVPEKTSYFENYKVDNLFSYIEHLLENSSDQLSTVTANFVTGLANEWVCLKYTENSTVSFIFDVEDTDKIEPYLKTKNSKIKRFENVELLEVLGLAKDIKQKYFYILYKNVLLIGLNEKEIKAILNDIKENRVFLQNENYIAYEPKLYENNFCLIYSGSINTSYKNNFKPVFHQLFTIDNDIFANTVFAYKNEGLTNKVNFEYKPIAVASNSSKTLNKWEKIVGQKIINGPNTFKNHYTNEKEYVVQDDKNNLYLIDKKDSILWTKKLDGAYLGQINMIDFYLNKKNQILLNTDNTIYLIDRKGRDVENFPSKLLDKATNGLVVVNYSDVSKVRYYIATNDLKLKAYDKNAKQVKGWNLPQLLGEVKLSVKHIVANNKDYLCAITKNGIIHLFSRDGTPRQAPLKTNIKNIESVELINKNELLVSNGKSSAKLNLQ